VPWGEAVVEEEAEETWCSSCLPEEPLVAVAAVLVFRHWCLEEAEAEKEAVLSVVEDAETSVAAVVVSCQTREALVVEEAEPWFERSPCCCWVLLNATLRPKAA